MPKKTGISKNATKEYNGLIALYKYQQANHLINGTMQEQITALITDLCHCLYAHGINPVPVLNQAKENFEAERER